MTTPPDDRYPEDPQPAPPPYAGSMPPVRETYASPAPEGPRPPEVEISFWLWMAGFLLGLAGLVVFVAQFDTIRDTVIEEAGRQMQREGGPFDAAQLRRITATALVVGVAVGLIFSAVELVLALFMRTGRNWARIVLTVLGGLGILSGISSLGSESGIRLASTMLSLLILIGAVVAMFLPPANAWFRARSARRGAPARPGI